MEARKKYRDKKTFLHSKPSYDHLCSVLYITGIKSFDTMLHLQTCLNTSRVNVTLKAFKMLHLNLKFFIIKKIKN